MTFYLEDTNNIQAHNAVVMAAADSMYVVQGITIGSSTDWDGVEAVSGAGRRTFPCPPRRRQRSFCTLTPSCRGTRP